LPFPLGPGLQIRKLFAPGFTGAEVERYLPRLQQIAERFAASWAAAGSIPSWQEELKLFTFEVICAVVAGIDWE
jgi:cytochrome P450